MGLEQVGQDGHVSVPDDRDDPMLFEVHPLEHLAVDHHVATIPVGHQFGTRVRRARGVLQIRARLADTRVPPDLHALIERVVLGAVEVAQELGNGAARDLGFSLVDFVQGVPRVGAVPSSSDCCPYCVAAARITVRSELYRPG